MTRLSKELTHLEAVGLIKLIKTHPELEYLFRHGLIQEAAYNSLLLEDRKKLHRQVGEAIEQTYPSRLEELASTLADHFVKAEEVEKAVHYLLLAGDQARGLYAHQEAIKHYRQALEFLKKQEDYERAARTLMKLGLTYHNAFDFKQSRQAYDEGFEYWHKIAEVQPAAGLPPVPHALRGTWENPRTLDPNKVGDTISLGVIYQLFSPLVEVSSDMDILPAIAQSWEILGGGQKYVFHLRDDVRWSDEVSVTAADFEYAWKRALNPVGGMPAASLYYDIKNARRYHQKEISNPDLIGVRALDALTLIVELEEPNGGFLYSFAHNVANPVPRHIVSRYGDAWSTVENIVTNGPFRLESWRQGESIILTRNPTYYGRFTGNVERVELTLRGDWSTRLENYAEGTLDTLVLPQKQGVVSVRQQYPDEFVSTSAQTTRYLGFVVNRPPFNDPRVGRAFAMAVDKEQYANQVANGLVAPATGGFMPPGIVGHLSEIGLPYDPDLARQLLAQANYPSGHEFPPVEWIIQSGQEQLAEYLQTQWRENLEVELSWQALDTTEFFGKLENRPPAMYLMKWATHIPDPDYFLRIYVETMRPRSQWPNETFDKLVNQARRSINQTERIRLYQQADRILIDDVPIIPLVYEPSHILVKPWVKKYPVFADGLAFYKDVIIEPH